MVDSIHPGVWIRPGWAAGSWAQNVGAKRNDASEKMTKRTSRMIVNCHRRRSTPRRLR